MLELALAGALTDWTVDLSRLGPTADYVAQVVRDRYPALNPPMHSRWRHFVFDGRDLWNDIAAQAQWQNAAPNSALQANAVAGDADHNRTSTERAQFVFGAGAYGDHDGSATRAQFAASADTHADADRSAARAQSVASADSHGDADRSAARAQFVAGADTHSDGDRSAAHAQFVAGADTHGDGDRSAARARAEFDLAITSVLLDAGAGPTWRYRDETTGIVATRSEGLALASLRWFANGGFSSDPRDPLRADAAALSQLSAAALNTAFQVSADNPLVGAEHRAALLNRLGAAMQARPDLFTSAPSLPAQPGLPLPTPGPTAHPTAEPTPAATAVRADPGEHAPVSALQPPSATALRLGGLFDHFARIAAGGPLPAAAILETLLEAFGSIWQNRPTLDGIPLGDCWPHPALQEQATRSGNPTDAYIALHKLSQWLSYSLIEPLQNAGIAVTGLNELTGLPEYRNGGLLIDMNVIAPRDPAALSKSHLVSEPFVIAWRALTVALLDRLAPLVGERLGLANDSFLLARVLEGGTWAAGRQLAREKRGDGSPPFQIQSDGTVL
jgi:hypothetical protein